MDWSKYIPSDADRQESPNPWAESNGCMSFAMVHCIEIQEKKILGFETDYSEQALCVESGTNPSFGNSYSAVYTTLQRTGLVKTSVLPEPVNFTVSQFYAPISPQILNTGKDWLSQWNVSMVSINPANVFSYLTQAPVMITIDLNPNGAATGYHQFHEVVLLNSNGDYLDSYGLIVKNLGNFKIYYANLLLLKKKCMSNVEFVNKAGTKEYGFYVPALSEDALKDKADNFGFNILNPDGTIAYPNAKQVTGL